MEAEQKPEERLLCEDKTRCCGCAACREICPAGAIAMREDKEGFLYPYINEAECVHCSLCRKVCPFHEDDTESEEAAG